MLPACDDFLDREPMANISPELYFSQADQLRDYANYLYTRVLYDQWNSYANYNVDNGTDNQVGKDINNRYTANLYLTGTGNGDWSFDHIYRCNFLLEQAVPKYEAGAIGGNAEQVKHYLGEIYFFRAYEYFKRYQVFGDFPIVDTPEPDDMQALREATKRQPRNEVARFILSDLEKAITLMTGNDQAKTRVNRDVAVLLKSRVALFEGTFLKYFKGTAFVPGGNGWPGATQHAGYSYPAGGIDQEINWFLDQSMAASKELAEKYKGQLTVNTGTFQQNTDGSDANPFYDMYSSEDIENIPEVLMWQQFMRGIRTHNINSAANFGNYFVGLTRGFVQNFLMADGTPVYTHGSYVDGDGYYKGDKTLGDVRANRDSRLSVFLKEKGQKNQLFDLDNAEGVQIYDGFTEPEPWILVTDTERGYTTGYALHKGGSFSRKHYPNWGGWTAAVSFRAAEALVNYMEASYERNGSLDASATEYWKLLRRRANVSDDIDNTIALTDMAKEAENDWGAYSAGQLIDKTLYNIRRERRSELMAEGFRLWDLRRWRAMDQLITTPYQIEGFHLWNTPMEGWYTTEELAKGVTDRAISSREVSEYLRPFQRYDGQPGYDGATWKMAHYLNPISIGEILVATDDGATVSTSTIYQNPYWPTAAGQPAEQ
jgi:hypothetical protein